jgi:tetratricopeptide (TPR) repeat protein
MIGGDPGVIGITISNHLQKPSTTNSSNGIGTAAESGDDDLALSLSLQFEGKFDKAIALYKQVFDREKNTIKGRYALRKLNECYLQLKRESEFKDYIDKSVKPKISAKDELNALVIGFENQALFEDKDYDGVIKNLTGMLKDYKNNEPVYKHALFNLGLTYLKTLNDSSQATKYFSHLVVKYPDDPLAMNAKYLFAEAVGQEGLLRLAQDLYEEQSIVEKGIPAEYKLSANYPNPFNPVTFIDYQLPVTSHVSLKVYDILGREVATLVDEMKEAGYYTATFNGSRLSSGVYFTRFIVQSPDGKSFVKVKKMLLTK